MINTIKNHMKKRNNFIDIRRLNWKIGYYKPKTNKVKQGALLGFMGLCLVTPCTNFLIPILLKGINKLSPIWLYK